MNATLITKVYEPQVNANWIICKSNDEAGIYLTKSEYLDANGKVEATSVGWSRLNKQQLVNMLGDMNITLDELDHILTA